MMLASLLTVSVCADDRQLFTARGHRSDRRLKKRSTKKKKKEENSERSGVQACELDLDLNGTEYSSQELKWIESYAANDENSTSYYAVPNTVSGSLCSCCIGEKCATGKPCEALLGAAGIVFGVIGACCFFCGCIAISYFVNQSRKRAATQQITPPNQTVTPVYPTGTVVVPAQNVVVPGQQQGNVMILPGQQPVVFVQQTNQQGSQDRSKQFWGT